MNSTVGKPLLGLMAAACVAVPAAIPQAAAAVPVVQSAADAGQHELFDPAPPILRLIPEAADPATYSPAAVVDGLQAAEAIDPDLLVKLLTFPYHNVYAIGTSVGAALNSALVAALLPLTAGYYFLTNQIDKIEPYIDTTFTNLGNAIPNIFTTIQNEINYDINLFKQVFGPDEAAEKEALATADTEAGALPDDPGLWLKLLSFPYHNVYAIGTSVGAALNSVVVAALSPLTAGYYFLTNQIDKIGPYFQTTFASLSNAIPNIFTTIKNEIDYDINLFKQIFTPAPDPELASLLDAARSVPETDSPAETLSGDDADAGVPSEQADDDTVEAPAAQGGAPTDGTESPVTGDAGEDVPDEEDTEPSAPEATDPPADADEDAPDAADDSDESDHTHATKLSDDADTYGRHAKKDVAQDSGASASAEN